MNKAVFDILSKKMIKNIDARKAVQLYLFSDVSAYHAEMHFFGTATVTVKKIADRLELHYQEALQLAMLDERPNMHKVNREVTIASLEDLKVFAYVHDGSISAIQGVDSGKDLSDLLDITSVYDDVECQLITVLKDGHDTFKLDY